MFSFFRSTHKAKQYMLGGIMLILAASMLTYLTQTGLTSASDDQTLAEVGDLKITANEAQQAINRLVQTGRLPADTADVYLPQYVDQLIQDRAMVYEFGKLGMTVSDDEVLAGIMSIFPQYFTNGKLTNKDALEQQLASQNASLDDLVSQMREGIMAKKVDSLAMSGIVVSPQEVDQELKQKHEKAQIEYVAFPAAKFRDQVKPTHDELVQAFNRLKKTYTLPEKRSFQVLVADQAKIEQTIQVTDAQLHAAYAANMDSFRTPERVKVRHILLMTQGKSDAEKKAALAKAQDLLKQIKGGADFADLAKKNSQDPGSAQNGGDLGFIVRGQTVPEFEKFAFSAQPNQISDIVTTEYGYHIIQVVGKEPARVKPFDEVKAALTDELKKQGVADKMQMIADQARAALAKSPGSAAEIAKQYGLDFDNVTNGAMAEPIPNLGVSPEIDGALQGLKPNEVTPVLVLPMNRMAFAVLLSRTPSRPAEFSEVEDKIRAQYIDQMSEQRAVLAAKDAYEKLKAGEDVEKFAKSSKMDYTKSAEFTRNDSVEGLGPAAYVLDAFTKPVGTLVGPVPIEGRQIIYKVINHQEADLKQYAAERDATVNELKQRKAREQSELLLDSLLAKARADGKVKIHQDTLKTLEASLRANH